MRRWSKKGMLANIIGGFVVILVAVSLAGPMAQEIEKAINCNITINSTNVTYEQPLGETGSFGGAGGDYHFGGYTGEVKHEVWGSQYSFINTGNQSMINPNCKPISENMKTLASLIPMFFAISIGITAIMIAYQGLRSAGLVGGAGEL